MEKKAAVLARPERAVFNLHVPPARTAIDRPPALDGSLKPVVKGGAVVMESVGSEAVRRVLEEYQPMLGLHGHIHESRGAVRLGSTLAVNPGSEYGDGVLCGALLEIDGKRGVRHCQLPPASRAGRAFRLAARHGLQAVADRDGQRVARAPAPARSRPARSPAACGRRRSGPGVIGVRQVCPRRQRVGVIRPEHPLAVRPGALVEVEALGHPARRVVGGREVAAHADRVRVIGALHPLPVGQRPLVSEIASLTRRAAWCADATR